MRGRGDLLEDTVLTDRGDGTMRKILLTALALLGGCPWVFSGPVPPSGCPTCIQNSAAPQNAQVNIGTAVVRGTLTVSTLTATYFSIGTMNAGNYIGNGGALTDLNATELTIGTVPVGRLLGQYLGISGVGALSTGTWNASIIGTQWGGTGKNWVAIAQGNLPYFSATGVMSTLSPGTAGALLQTNGAGANPSWTSAPQIVGTNVTSIPLANLLAGNLPQNVAINDSSISTVSAAKVIGNISGGASFLTVPLPIGNLAGGTLPTSNAASSITVNGVVPGVYGGPTQLAQINVHADGRIYAVSQSSIVINPNQISSGTLAPLVLVPAANITSGTLNNSVIASSLNATGVAPGVYGGPTQSAQLTIDVDGRVTSATQLNIPGASSSTAMSNADNAWNHSQTSLAGSSWTIKGNLSAFVTTFTYVFANGYGLTNLTAANISSGTLGPQVIASSIGANGMAAGIYGTATESVRITVGLDGRISTATTVTITGVPASSVPAAGVQPGNLGPTVIASSLNATGVTAATIGSSSQSLSITVAGDGRLSAAAAQAILIVPSQVSTLVTTLNALGVSTTALSGSTVTLAGRITALETSTGAFSIWQGTISPVIANLGISTNTFGIWMGTASLSLANLASSTAAFSVWQGTTSPVIAALGVSTNTLQSSKVSRAGDSMTGQLTIAGATFTVTGLDGSGFGERILYGIDAGSITSRGSIVAVGTMTVLGQDASGVGVKIVGSLDVNGIVNRDGSVAVGTMTVIGNAFSVGGSSFSVAGGSATLAYLLSAQSGNFSGRLAVSSGPFSLGNVFVTTSASGLVVSSMNLTATGNGVYALNVTSAAYFGEQATAKTALYTPLLSSPGGLLTLQTIGASAIVFVTLGTERMRIRSNGNIGIGTATPDSLFTVAGVGQFTSGVTASSFTATQTGVNGSIVTSSGIFINGAGPLKLSAGGSIVFGDGTTQTTAATGSGSGENNTFGFGGSTKTYLSTVGMTSATVSGQLIVGGTVTVFGNFSVGGSTFVVVGGSVSIGGTSPGGRLDVNGSAVFGAAGSRSTFTDTGRLLVPIAIGINTTSPGSKLEVRTDGANPINIGDWGGGNTFGAIGLAGDIGSTGYNMRSSNADTNLYINVPLNRSIKLREADVDMLIVTKTTITVPVGITLDVKGDLVVRGPATIVSSATILDGSLRLGGVAISTQPGGNIVIPFISHTSMTVSGAILSYSSITASSFFGSGMVLTGESTATYYYGSGFGLTSLQPVNIISGILGAGVVASSVAATGVSAGTCGDATISCRITISGDGRILARSSSTISGTGNNTVTSSFTVTDGSLLLGGVAITTAASGLVFSSASLTALGAGVYTLQVASGLAVRGGGLLNLQAASGILWPDGKISTTGFSGAWGGGGGSGASLTSTNTWTAAQLFKSSMSVGYTGTFRSTATLTEGVAVNLQQMVASRSLSSTAKFDFSSLKDNTFYHLKLQFTQQTSNAGKLQLQFNGDTGAAHRWSVTCSAGVLALNATGTNDYVQLNNTGVQATTPMQVELDFKSDGSNTTVTGYSSSFIAGSVIEGCLIAGQWTNAGALTSMSVNDSVGSMSGSAYLMQLITPNE